MSAVCNACWSTHDFETIHVHMHTKLENGVLRNGQQLGSAVNTFLDNGKFEAMKTLSTYMVIELRAAVSFVLKLW